MDLKPIEPPREFNPYGDIILKDCAHVELKPGEQITFKNEAGQENDVAATEWGFYLTNSINFRLRERGLKTALVQSIANGTEAPRVFIKLVKKEKLEEFEAYLETNKSRVICWLDEWFENQPNKE